MTKSLLSKILISVAACLIIGFLSGLATTDSINEWYVNINKPSFNPPNWIFGPVWSILYTMMGIAAGVVWHQGIERPEVKAALYVFVSQIILNATWSIIFFGMKNPMFAFIEIIILLILIGICIFRFYKIKKIAAYLMIPYMLWVSFASVLNYCIMVLN